MNAGIMPNDPLAPVLDALADIPDEVDLRIAPALAEMQAAKAEIRAACAAIEKAADKPLMTDHQVKWTVVPALLAAWNVWQMLLLVAAVAIGFGMHWWLTPTLTCQDERGGSFCFYWKVQPTEQPAQQGKR
jgi:hypothetical protein